MHIVVANKAFLDQPDLDLEKACGLRPGESFGCIHAYKDGIPSCGTTEFCRTCGAANSISRGLEGSSVERECRINRGGDLSALDLRVKSTPLVVKDEPFTLFVIADISHEKRRLVLERIFFHDILNAAGSIRGLADLMLIGSPEKREYYTQLLFQSSEGLIREINAQKDLCAAENNDLEVHPVPIHSLTFLEEIRKIYENQITFQQFAIRIHEGAEDIAIINDKSLLARVIANMVKNALESSTKGDIVTMGCKKVDGKIRFRVHNPSSMTRSVQLQVFQRSFSTKARDRGLGTYSMKLLTERYLKGTIRFTSSAEKGTTFTATYPLEI